jgi:hypothetical protein
MGGIMMLKKLFSLSNPLGLALTAATLILTISPEARRGTRKLLVKGTATVLSLGDQFKGITTGARKQLGTFMEEAKAEKEHLILPDVSQTLKSAGETMRNGVNDAFNKMKQSTETFADTAMETSTEFFHEPLAETSEETSIKKSHTVRSEPDFSKVQNVMSDEFFKNVKSQIQMKK